MPNISDVAKHAGLSKATVSRVINNHPYISKEKRELVQQAMKELGYHPNPSARRLRGHLTSTIGVIVPRIVNPFFAYLVNAIEQAAYANEYQVLIFQSDESREKEISFLNLLKTKQVDGVIMTSIENDWHDIKPYSAYGPIVCCNEYVQDPLVPTVKLNQTEGAYAGVKHLIERGHKKIGYSTGALFAGEGRDKDRNDGYQKALKEADLDLNPSWIFVNKHTIDDGKQIIRQMMNMNDRPTALFSGSDEIAAGAMSEAKAHGIRIPEDLAILGFDDQPIAELLDPPLTTIRQPIDDLGEKSVEQLLRFFKDKSAQSECVDLPFELIVRKST
ncbi:LacI family DNA-binding transcriptional regulator [Halobacillus litoralis]|uniref:LacI family DNA-binding transcriptional regulator n=1 Tax=Halobacillus litoralis TaxID=45668 RepID=UPI001CFE310A|nr:LacI family DNA-binding transcriptional regulator [Halobacillus litoralis]